MVPLRGRFGPGPVADFCASSHAKGLADDEGFSSAGRLFNHQDSERELWRIFIGPETSDPAAIRSLRGAVGFRAKLARVATDTFSPRWVDNFAARARGVGRN